MTEPTTPPNPLILGLSKLSTLVNSTMLCGSEEERRSACADIAREALMLAIPPSPKPSWRSAVEKEALYLLFVLGKQAELGEQSIAPLRGAVHALDSALFSGFALFAADRDRELTTRVKPLPVPSGTTLSDLGLD